MPVYIIKNIYFILKYFQYAGTCKFTPDDTKIIVGGDGGKLERFDLDLNSLGVYESGTGWIVSSLI